LQIHPKDAGRRGIESGDRVRVYNERGAVEIAAAVDDATLESVVTMPHGFWASLLPGGSSANALTPDGLSDLGGGGSFYDTRVEVAKIG
jgi:anaerobic selenocysteine-containing dehydrogenase